MKRIVLIFTLLGACVLGASAANAEGPSAVEVPILGSKAFAQPFGAGFGHAEPSVIFNGGDPSGEVSQIHWRSWGGPTAIGFGRNPIFRPKGGYYRALARVELRATNLGECNDHAAYTRLEIRVPRRPGSHLTGWRLWSGAKTICQAPR
ncbi:MAG TPA: hypothetical protein VGC32_12505 [Solirubrobacterales bacterium]